MKRLLAALCCFLIACPAWAVNEKELRALFWRSQTPMIQPIMMSNLVLPASGAAAQYVWAAPGGGPNSPPVQTVAVGAPIYNPGAIGNLTVTIPAFDASAGTVTVEILRGVAGGTAGGNDTNVGCTFNATSQTSCKCTQDSQSQCTHAPTVSYGLVYGQTYTIKFTSSGTSWASMAPTVSWTFTPANDQAGNLWTGTAQGNTGANAVTLYFGPSTQDAFNATESLVTGLEPPGLGIYITGFIVHLTISDTSPGHTWTLIHNGTSLSTAFQCATTTGATVKTCTTPAGTAPVYIAPYDTFSVQCVGTSGSVAEVAEIGIGFKSAIPGESPLFAYTNTGTTATGAWYNLVGGFYAGAQTTEATYQTAAPAVNSFAVSNLLAFQTTQNASGKHRVFTVRNAGANTALTANIPPNAASGIGGGALSGIIATDLAHTALLTPGAFVSTEMTADTGSTLSGVVRISMVAVVK